jgi:hypothetical protein
MLELKVLSVAARRAALPGTQSGAVGRKTALAGEMLHLEARMTARMQATSGR